IQSSGTQAFAIGSPRESRGVPSTSSPSPGLTLVLKFQALGQSVREMQAQENERRIAALANEVYYSILQFVEARRVAGTNS
ncbi:MAG: hypothetical protein K2X47_13760, partial [Bdellovibrionales bacterium]|nr:hypothetical protein [Bdellovibrionales bacterium]